MPELFVTGELLAAGPELFVTGELLAAGGRAVLEVMLHEGTRTRHPGHPDVGA